MTDELRAALNAVSDKEDFAKCLTRLWIMADRPSYRSLSALALRNGQSLSKTMIGQVLGGHVLPRKNFLTTFLTCCGVGLDEYLEWERAWTRLAPIYYARRASSPQPALDRRSRPPVERPSAAADEQHHPVIQLIDHLRRELAQMSAKLAEVQWNLDRIDPRQQTWSGQLPVPETLEFADLIAGEWWKESSATGLVATVGLDPLRASVKIELGDRPPHGLIVGPSGSGKTNFIFALLAGVCTRYSPDELEIYLLDFKEGVSFNWFAPDVHREPWIPHVRLVGVNINSDPEFGLALLQHLSWELRRRAAAARRHHSTTIEELRRRDRDGHWPRTLAVVDEFQWMLAGRHSVATECAKLLEDLARRGRAMGIHLILASQEVTGVEVLWGRPGLVAQFGLRVALPRARRVLAERNGAADEIPLNHAVVNPDSGSRDANRIVRVPLADNPDDWAELRRRLWEMRSPESEPPVIFDGDVAPKLGNVPTLGLLQPGSRVAPVAAVGHAIDVLDRPAFVRFERRAGRNLALVGNRDDLAHAVICAAVTTLARQFAPGEARFTLVGLDDAAHHDAMRLRRDAGRRDFDVYGQRDLGGVLNLAFGDPLPHFLVLFPLDTLADSGSPASEEERAVSNNLLQILDRGPLRGIHVIGWWRRASHYRRLFRMASQSELITATVLVGATVSDLPLTPNKVFIEPDPPRRNRVLLIDLEHNPPYQTVVPYAV
ncbi:FtsK/SpoIIIE domain-containing protein [Micromonospora sp. WMMD1102]|uniref:FtsK/SpoIIIE domain-containing protein n=1 Tax=Micromonospora sp. WMMD1102 TaxID=3016105 RepID=UPI0024153B49|nr:FtsK/SpoIIIE domain-containing protein [Micromonospora sp. WMMD1102]MDG4791309.1 FtsK/SpoIIIE domain-containing protein [Micromonospora sp. WMMD1102]